MKPYVIVAPKYTSKSAGISGLYRLCDQLNDIGCKARVIRIEEDHLGNQVITLVRGSTLPTDEDIVIYPDHGITGNPFNAKNVVRYLMMYAGYFGQKAEYPASEYMYYFAPEFVYKGRNPDNILTIPCVDEDKFKPVLNKNREGTCYLAIKYCDWFRRELPPDLPKNAIKITKETDLPKLFSKVKTLITFDDSSINLEALMSGVEVVYRHSDLFKKNMKFGEYWDLKKPRESYLKLKQIYREKQLPEFIRKTQEHFGEGSRV